MKPRNTMYRLMEPTDRPILSKIWTDNKKLFGAPGELGFPTVVAEREGTILGFLSTDTSNHMIVAAPLIVTKGSSPFTVMRLVQAYENVLKLAGVTQYLFHVDKKNRKWVKIVKELSALGAAEQYDKTTTGLWYKRGLQ